MTKISRFETLDVVVTIVPCLEDNYSYLVECTKTGARVVVDPSEAKPIRGVLGDGTLDAIWCTHHHFDHVGGNEALVSGLGIREVLGHESESARIPNFTRGVKHGERFKLGHLDVEILFVPGHTRGAIAYLVSSSATRLLFSGDTLFLAGCGRLFEGTAAMMLESFDRIAACPDDTQIFPGHEYTASNLRFTQSLGFVDTDDALTEVKEKRAHDVPTVPWTLGTDKRLNAFFNVDNAALVSKLGLATSDRATIFGALRKRKDTF